MKVETEPVKDFKGFLQKKDTNKRPSEIRNRRKTRKKIINKTSYFLSNSLNKSLNQK